jgi:hypothetical protein
MHEAKTGAAVLKLSALFNGLSISSYEKGVHEAQLAVYQLEDTVGLTAQQFKTKQDGYILPSLVAHLPVCCHRVTDLPIDSFSIQAFEHYHSMRTLAVRVRLATISPCMSKRVVRRSWTRRML